MVAKPRSAAPLVRAVTRRKLPAHPCDQCCGAGFPVVPQRQIGQAQIEDRAVNIEDPTIGQGGLSNARHSALSFMGNVSEPWRYRPAYRPKGYPAKVRRSRDLQTLTTWGPVALRHDTLKRKAGRSIVAPAWREPSI